MLQLEVQAEPAGEVSANGPIHLISIPDLEVPSFTGLDSWGAGKGQSIRNVKAAAYRRGSGKVLQVSAAVELADGLSTACVEVVTPNHMAGGALQAQVPELQWGWVVTILCASHEQICELSGGATSGIDVPTGADPRILVGIQQALAFNKQTSPLELGFASQKCVPEPPKWLTVTNTLP